MRRLGPTFLLVAALGCTGIIDGADPGYPRDRADPPAPGGEPPAARAPGTASEAGVAGGVGAAGASRSVLDRPGPMPLARLGREELARTLRDLLGHDPADVRRLPADGRGLHGFADPGPISNVDAEHLLELVDRVGVTIARRLPQLLACDPAAAGEAACVRQLVGRFGRRAWRRPLLPEEVTELVEYFGQVRAQLGHGFQDAARVVLQAMLLAPGFLYHWELGPRPAAAGVADGLIPLGPHEAAARLSYFVWGSMPDDALFAAVDGGRFTTEADVTREARRMLASSKARAAVASFHSQWLALDRLSERQKDPRAYPMWSSTLARAMADETAEFSARTILDGDGSLRTLLTAPSTFVDANLAKLYGVPAPSGSQLVAAPLDPRQRAGILTHASFLAVHASASGSHPVKRGHKIYQDVLCGEVPSPPDDVPAAGTPSASLSTRELFAEHAQNRCAIGCHGLIDPPGFAFEHYDAIGRWRATDGGKPVDASGALVVPSGGPARPFADAVGLAATLASLEEVQRCVARQWFRYALARLETPGDAASFESAHGAFRGSGHNLRELIVKLATVRSFLYRAPAEGEVLR